MNSAKNNTDKTDIGCLEAIETLYAYLDDELNDPKSIAEFEHHMSHCRSCYSRAEVENLLTDRIRKSSGSRASSSLQERLRKLMDDLE